MPKTPRIEIHFPDHHILHYINENQNLYVWYSCERNKVFISSTDISNENEIRKRAVDQMICENQLDELLM